MKQFLAFFYKECLELMRTGKLFILTIIFVFCGIMNPGLAKLTPWIMEMASDSMGDTGIVITEVNVDAMTSWAQFYKNVPIVIIVFLVIFSGTLANEYQKGTLINMVTKGLSRWKIVLSKLSIMIIVWTVLYWLSFFITYGYNEFYWDNSIAKNLFFGAFCIYIMGVWLISVLIFAQVLFSTNISSLLITGVGFGIFYMIGLLTKIKDWLPTGLLQASELLSGVGCGGDYKVSIIVSVILVIINICMSVLVFNKKTL